MTDIITTDKQYVAGTYNRFPIEIINGHGSEVFDSNGNPVGVIGVGIEPVENKRFYGKFDDLTHYEYNGASIELPKGTIKQLIGKKLTWKDAPVELL